MTNKNLWTRRPTTVLIQALALSVHTACTRTTPQAQPPPLTPAPSSAPSPALPARPNVDRCAEARAQVAAAQSELTTGRLLRVIAFPVPSEAECAKEAAQLGAVVLEATRSLGIPASAGGSPAGGPRLYGPDGPVAPPESDARVGYDQATAAYKAEQWARAEALALPIGAQGGPLAGEAFVLAGRSAEHRQDHPRAARMWARAYRALCPKPSACAAQAPHEDTFSRVALFGNYVPWYSADFCSGGIRGGAAIVNGKWSVSPSPGGMDIRDVPSRVLLEHVEAPAEAEWMCFSSDGRQRIAVAAPVDPERRFFFQTSGGAWHRTGLPKKIFPDDSHTHVLNDGRVLFAQGDYSAVFEPGNVRFHLVSLASTDVSGRGRVSESGFFYTDFFRPSSGSRPASGGPMRFSLASGRGVVLTDFGNGANVGPVDEKDRFLVISHPDVAWSDGNAGSVLAKLKAEVIPGSGWGSLGVVPPSTIAWMGSKGTLQTVNVATGTVEDSGVVGYLASLNAGPITQILGQLPLGATSRTWSQVAGWKLVGTRLSESTLEGNPRGMLRVVVTANHKGAFVSGPDGHFEFVGEVSSVFRASASCQREPHSDDKPSEGPWPIEVCGAALEDPGLTERWFNGIVVTPNGMPDGGAP